MRVSPIAELGLVATLKLRRHNKVLCIYICNHILLKNRHIFKQKNMKILLLFLPKNPDKWDIFKKSHLSGVRLSGTFFVPLACPT